MLKILGQSRCYMKRVFQKICLSKTFQVSYRDLRVSKKNPDTLARRRKVIGIDLGSTYSCMAVMKENVPEIIKNEGEKTISSAVYLGTRWFRHFANCAEGFIIKPTCVTISSVKRLIGRKFDDPELQKEMLRSSSHIVPAPNGEALLDFDGKTLPFIKVSSSIFEGLKEVAESYLKYSVKASVLTVPSDFSDLQKQVILAAGKRAGLTVLSLLEEPLAAALAYGCGTKDEVIAVYNLGGRTFNITIYDIRNGIFKVKSQLGDNFLGGEDFDDVLRNYTVEEFKRNEGLDLLKYVDSMEKFKQDVEATKCRLSNLEKDTLSCDCVFDRAFLYNGITVQELHPKRLEITREKFEHLVSDLINRTIEMCQKAVSEAKMNASDIQKVVLVGGMTKMPKIQERVKNFFNSASTMCSFPDEAIAMGAAILGKALADYKSDLTRHLMASSFSKDGKFPLMVTTESLNAKYMIFPTETDALERQSEKCLNFDMPECL